ncbi:MAG: hypothetical protein M1820_009567 [Bogoriella megaspora]|nr:MAG: hypothetical protein M1820_009567 [Bogoriella megaspora]
MPTYAAAVYEPEDFNFSFITTTHHLQLKSENVKTQVRAQAARRLKYKDWIQGRSKAYRDGQPAAEKLRRREPPLSLHNEDVIVKNKRSKILDLADNHHSSHRSFPQKANCKFCSRVQGFWRQSPVSLLDGDVDPFTCLPQLTNPHVNNRMLFQYSANNGRPWPFRSWMVLASLAPSCVSKNGLDFASTGSLMDAAKASAFLHRIGLLTASLVSSIHLDTVSGRPEDSLVTTSTMTDIVAMINTVMADPLSSAGNLVIMSVTQLLTSEIVTGNYERIEMHTKGLIEMLHGRGGLKAMLRQDIPQQALARCSVIATFLAAALHEVRASALSEVDAPFNRPTRFLETLPFLESPLFCLTSEYVFLSRKRMRSAASFDILDYMQQLTRKFLGDEKARAKVDTGEEVDENTSYNAAEVLDKLRDLSSAAEPSSSVAKDWVYECIRLASLVYTTALLHRVPFSVAMCHTHDPKTGSSGRSLIRLLSKSLSRTQIPSDWDAMGGALLWVGLVGGAASRPPRTLPAAREFREDEDEGYWGGSENSIALGASPTTTPPANSEVKESWTSEDEVARKWLTMAAVGYQGMPSTEHAEILGVTPTPRNSQSDSPKSSFNTRDITTSNDAALRMATRRYLTFDFLERIKALADITRVQNVRDRSNSISFVSKQIRAEYYEACIKETKRVIRSPTAKFLDINTYFFILPFLCYLSEGYPKELPTTLVFETAEFFEERLIEILLRPLSKVRLAARFAFIYRNGDMWPSLLYYIRSSLLGSSWGRKLRYIRENHTSQQPEEGPLPDFSIFADNRTRQRPEGKCVYKFYPKALDKPALDMLSTDESAIEAR